MLQRASAGCSAPLPISVSVGANAEIAARPLFGRTTTARLLRDFFDAHASVGLVSYCYAFEPADGSRVRQAIGIGCTTLRELHGHSMREAAASVNADGVHVLVDLTGYTINPVVELFHYRAAPRQLQFHGFPGTMGSTAYDALVGDVVSTTAEMGSHFTEPLLLLPTSYLLNTYAVSMPRSRLAQPWLQLLLTIEAAADASAELPQEEWRELAARKRADSSLVVFACFNQLYKIDLATFTAWVMILKQVRNSVLWLLRHHNRNGERRLKERAAAHGLGDRLIFTELIASGVEIEAKSMVDVFLDTALYNAHTTAIDTCWASVPILTLPGVTMQSRVASALLMSHSQSIGVARSWDDYVNLGTTLALNASKRAELRASLREAVAESRGLWNVRRWMKHFRSAVRLVLQVDRPMHIVVRDCAATE
jgi:predicted O-linked N-acetylglucosamine transferase (SPINDLY family)